MLRMKLAYLAIIIVSAIFFVMYVDSLSLILLIFVLLLPVITFFLGLIAKCMTDVNVDIEPLVIVKGTHTHVLVSVRNKSIISAPYARLTVRYANNFDEKSGEEAIIFPVPARKGEDFKLDLSSQHCGIISVSVIRVDFYDFLRVWHFKKKLNRSFEVTVIPEAKMIDASVNFSSRISFESDRFSKDKSGDDPSEVFKIRDYQGGDKLNRIHWKLSTKQDSLLVKEYSLPVNYSIVLLLELSADKQDKNCLDYIDGIIETASSISSFLTENEICHVICWADGDTGMFCEQEISCKDDLYETVGMLVETEISDNMVASLGAFKNCGRVGRCSHLVYVTAGDINSAAGLLNGYMFDITVAHVTGEETYSGKTSGFNVVSVSPENVEESLYRIVL